MTIKFGAFLASVLVLGLITTPSFAEMGKRKPKHPHPAAPMSAPQSDWKGVSEDFFAGAPEDPGSSNRYFSDTRQPDNRTLGAPIFERWQ